MDIFSTENFIQDNFKFVPTNALNNAFDFYGIGNQIMLINSGSYFVLQLLILFRVYGFCFINLIVTAYPENHYMRLIGIKVYIQNPNGEVKSDSIKLLIENFFDMGIAVLLNINAFIVCGEFELFFKGASNIVNSVLTIIMSIIMSIFLLYCHYVVWRFYKNIDQKKVSERLEPFIDGGSKRTFYSASMNVFFLYRRILTILILIWMQAYPPL